MIFILFAIGSVLIILNVRALKKEKNSFQFTLNNAGNDMEEFEVQIGALRREFSETILELQMEIQSLKKEEVTKNENETQNKEKIQKVKTKQDEKIIKTSQEKSENNTTNSVKINEIEKLISQGLTTEEISVKLGMGMGEVLLIKQLYIK
jgi:competence protein ComGC